uniref:MAGE family member B10 n=1 Tax=Cavia porcellus TaxID=10141 RepID=H0VVU4_CAVPO
MPRGQKSKHRAREKRRQAREEPTPSTSLHSLDNPEDSNEDPTSQVEEMLKDLQLTTKDYQEDSVDERVAILVHYLLYKYQIKEPVTKVEILKNVSQISKNQFVEVLKKASEHLELIFGLDVKEVDPYKNIYVLVNKLDLDQVAEVDDHGSVPTTGLLMTILGVIFTKGNRATEEQIWEVLNMMGIYAGSLHFFFGDAKKLITKDLVKEKYLQYQQVPNSNPPRYEFTWGPRAHAETSKMEVLEFLAKIHNCPPSVFTACYAEALKDQEERAQARAASRARLAAVANLRSRVSSSS